MPNQLFMAIQHIECGFNEKNNNFSLKVNKSKTIEKRCNIYKLYMVLNNNYILCK